MNLIPRLRLAPLALLLALAACAPQPAAVLAPAVDPDAVTHTVVGHEIGEDAAVAAMVAPYREQLEAEMRAPVAEAAFEIARNDAALESTLNNLAADAMLAVAEEVAGERFDFAVGNQGGLRVPIAAGTVTLGNVFELMPFENYLVGQVMTGVQVDSLAQQIARYGGEPVAGIRFAVTPDARAVDIEIRGEPLDRGRTYRVVTHNYLAYGGGDMPALWEPVDRFELPVPLRDAFVSYFRQQGTLAPQLDGRIRPAD
jgi:2',3'-cyclic-nucleotide 2'-phosphodiesterase (5'-nucleotidase family)